MSGDGGGGARARACVSCVVVCRRAPHGRFTRAAAAAASMDEFFMKLEEVEWTPFTSYVFAILDLEQYKDRIDHRECALRWRRRRSGEGR